MRQERKEMDEIKLNSNRSGEKIGNDFSISGHTNEATSTDNNKKV